MLTKKTRGKESHGHPNRQTDSPEGRQTDCPVERQWFEAWWSNQKLWYTKRLTIVKQSQKSRDSLHRERYSEKTKDSHLTFHIFFFSQRRFETKSDFFFFWFLRIDHAKGLPRDPLLLIFCSWSSLSALLYSWSFGCLDPQPWLSGIPQASTRLRACF